MGRPKKYLTEEERLEARRESARRWREKHPDSKKESYQRNRAQILAKKAELAKTPKGRAIILFKNYKREDEKYNRGECTLTPEWIVENIFSGQVCAHCGESDWRNLGCNRLNNDLPHTPDNVEPCCRKCNDRLAHDEQKKAVYQYTIDGKLVKVWESTMECERNGFYSSNISSCCNDKLKTYKGYIWSYVPL